MLKLKLQYFGHLMQRADSLEKTLLMGKIEGRKQRRRQRMKWLDGITNSKDMSLNRQQEIVKDRDTWHTAVHGVAKNQTCLSGWTTQFCYERWRTRLGTFSQDQLPNLPYRTGPVNTLTVPALRTGTTQVPSRWPIQDPGLCHSAMLPAMANTDSAHSCFFTSLASNSKPKADISNWQDIRHVLCLSCRKCWENELRSQFCLCHKMRNSPNMKRSS